MLSLQESRKRCCIKQHFDMTHLVISSFSRSGSVA